METQTLAASPSLAAVPRLRRTLTLWYLIFYGIVLIQPIAPVPLYGVAQKLSDGHFVTIILIALFAMLISVGVGVPIGVVAAWRKGSWLDLAVMVFAVSGFSMPTFWLGFILVYVFAITAGWLPVQGYAPLAGGVKVTGRLPCTTFDSFTVA